MGGVREGFVRTLDFYCFTLRFSLNSTKKKFYLIQTYSSSWYTGRSGASSTLGVLMRVRVWLPGPAYRWFCVVFLMTNAEIESLCDHSRDLPPRLVFLRWLSFVTFDLTLCHTVKPSRCRLWECYFVTFLIQNPRGWCGWVVEPCLATFTCSFSPCPVRDFDYSGPLVIQNSTIQNFAYLTYGTASSLVSTVS